MQSLLAVVVAVLLSVHTLHSYRILGIIPTPSISHQLPFRLIALELVRRGHQVTLITPDPIRKSLENYTEVDLSESYNIARSDFDATSMYTYSATDMISTMTEYFEKVCKTQLGSRQMKTFIQSRPSFDAVVIERLGYQSYYGLIHQVGSPILIGFVSFEASPPLLDALGNPNNPAYWPDFMLSYTDRMNFWERLHSAYLDLYCKYKWHFQLIPMQEAIMRENFGTDPPPIVEMEGNFSLLLENNHFSTNYPRPKLPNIIELTGLHLEKERRPLPENIKNFLDEADHGVIYFSLGSNVRSADMPEEKRLAFVSAFAQLPQRVLWKYETGNMPDLPHNVMVSKWLPQQDVLAHPKIRLFITQGGLQSMNEAGYFGVPLIGIPFLADQHHNVAKMVQSGIGYRLLFEDVTTSSMINAIRTVLGNESYRQNMKRFSAVYREHQETSLERAVWWIEYVIRHNGAPHLRSAALDLHWWQLLLLDVVAFVVVMAALAIYFLYKMIRYVAATLRTNQKVKSL